MFDARTHAKRSAILSVSSLLSILLLTHHLTADIVFGYEKANLSVLVAVPVVLIWLYAAVVLIERRSGHIITLVFSLLSLYVSYIHMRGNGVRDSVVQASGGFLFIWGLILIVLIGLFSAVLAAHGLWTLGRGKPVSDA